MKTLLIRRVPFRYTLIYKQTIALKYHSGDELYNEANIMSSNPEVESM